MRWNASDFSKQINCSLYYWMQSWITNHSNYNRCNPLCLKRWNSSCWRSIPKQNLDIQMKTSRIQKQDALKLYATVSAHCTLHILLQSWWDKEYVLIPMGIFSQISPALCDINQIHLYCNTCIRHTRPSLWCTSDEDLSACRDKRLIFEHVTRSFFTVRACSVQVSRSTSVGCDKIYMIMFTNDHWRSIFRIDYSNHKEFQLYPTANIKFLLQISKICWSECWYLKLSWIQRLLLRLYTYFILIIPSLI